MPTTAHWHSGECCHCHEFVEDAYRVACDRCGLYYEWCRPCGMDRLREQAYNIYGRFSFGDYPVFLCDDCFVPHHYRFIDVVEES